MQRTRYVSTLPLSHTTPHHLELSGTLPPTLLVLTPMLYGKSYCNDSRRDDDHNAMAILDSFAKDTFKYNRRLSDP